MHRHGHLGIVLLALAPVLYLLLAAGRPFFALLAWGVLVIEPLPDYDLRTSLLSHRGMSHTLVAAGVVGLCCAGIGWAAGAYLTVPFATWLTAEVLPMVDVAELTWVAERLGALDAVALASVGFVIGVSGIVLHLLGDVITVMGIRPYLPFSRRQVSLSSLRAKNRIANGGLFALGVLAIVAVSVFSTPLGELLLAFRGYM